MRDDPLPCAYLWFVGSIDGWQWAHAAPSPGLETVYGEMI
jgi:hypothetical protein